jgi:hypothetical protein
MEKFIFFFRFRTVDNISGIPESLTVLWIVLSCSWNILELIGSQVLIPGICRKLLHGIG